MYSLNAVYVLVLKLLLHGASDHGCFGSPLHYQEQSILKDQAESPSQDHIICHPVISQFQPEPEDLTISHPVSTHLQGCTTVLPLGFLLIWEAISTFPRSRVPLVQTVSHLSSNKSSYKYACKRNSTLAGGPSIVLRAAAHCREVPLKHCLSSLTKARIFRGP